MDGPTEIPIFPLNQVVLFPMVQTPLHVFEPRYRQMAKDAMEGSGVIGMATVVAEQAHDLSGNPPVYPIGCAGRVVQAHPLPDGRLNIVLVGLQRFRVLDELAVTPGSDRLYRVARVEYLSDPYPDALRERTAELRQTIIDELAELLATSDPEVSAQFGRGEFASMEDAGFINALASNLALHPQEKQTLLEAASVPERYAQLEGLLAFRVAELRSRGASGSGRVH